MPRLDDDPQPPPRARGESGPSELASASRDSLLELAASGRLSEDQICALLERKDLSGAVLGKIVQCRAYLRAYPVRRALAFHPHVPRPLALRLIRELYTGDLVSLSLAPATPPDLRRVAEDQLLSRLAQLALGEKISLAKKAPGRVAASLVAEGNRRVIGPGLQNPRLTEAQILRLLANENTPAAVLSAVAGHPRWQVQPNVCLALLRHPGTPGERVATLASLAATSDLKALRGVRKLSADVKEAIEREVAARSSEVAS